MNEEIYGGMKFLRYLENLNKSDDRTFFRVSVACGFSADYFLITIIITGEEKEIEMKSSEFFEMERERK